MVAFHEMVLARRLTICVSLLVLAAIAASCSGARCSAAGLLRLASVKISGVPHVQQKPDFCGEACAEMYLRKLNVAIDQNEVFEQSGLDAAQGRGCYTADLVRALQRIGFNTGPVWYSISAQDAWPSLNDEFAALHTDLQRGVPSIVCMRFDDQPQAPEHF